MTSTHHVDIRPVGTLQLTVLGQFSLRRSDVVRSPVLPVSRGGQRLLALLALHKRPVARAWVASLLWGDSDERHGSWSLRSTLHRLPRPFDVSPVEASHDRLALSSAVAVDVLELTRTARPSHGPQQPVDAPVPEDADDAQVLDHISALECDVLPDWHEDWVVVERERHRQLRLHALEAMASRLTDARRYGLAIHAGLAAVQAEPLRESAHQVVIAAHLAEGNTADALRQYGACRRQLLDELGISPSRRLQDLVFGRSDARSADSMSS